MNTFQQLTLPWLLSSSLYQWSITAGLSEDLSFPIFNAHKKIQMMKCGVNIFHNGIIN